MRVEADVDLGAISENIRNIKDFVKDTPVLAVVKADAYGHGILEVSRALVENGADFLGVAVFDEAKCIHDSGIKTPILILGAVCDDEIFGAVQYDVRLTVFDVETAKKISDAAVRLKKTARIHIKIDTGMSRIGLCPESPDTIREILEIGSLPGISIEGIFSHLSKADEKDRSYTDFQFSRFITLCETLKKRGVSIPIRHICNSAGILCFPEYHLDMVRSGIITYGHYPSDAVPQNTLRLRPAMAFKSRVVSIREMERGTLVGYGGTFCTAKKTKIATISVGYADGYFRSLSNKGEVCICNHRCKVAGNVCMDQLMADITGYDDIKIGDTVILFGKCGNNSITVEEVAQKAGTINYEILCAVSKRVPRVYIQSDKRDMG